jgi:dTDP-4-dehydrorhamnose reductase
MQQAGPLKGYTHALWTGLTTLELAKIMEYAAKVGATGLYNMVHEEPISKYDLLQLFNKYLRGGAVSIAAETNYVSDKSLKRTRFDFDYIVPDYDIMVYELSEWIKAHKHNYPHYGSL